MVGRPVDILGSNRETVQSPDGAAISPPGNGPITPGHRRPLRQLTTIVSGNAMRPARAGLHNSPPRPARGTPAGHKLIGLKLVEA